MCAEAPAHQSSAYSKDRHLNARKREVDSKAGLLLHVVKGRAEAT